MEKVKIRGLSRIVSWIFGIWGTVVFFKAVHDLFLGQPEANVYAPKPWDFVTREQWLRYGGFELVYALACLALSGYAFFYGKRFPEWMERPRRNPQSPLFTK